MSKNKNGGIVYSTDPNFVYASEEEVEDVQPKDQTLYVSIDRLKGGKVATVIEGFQGKDESLKEMGKKLKQKLGVGGSVKDGIVIIQGEFREKVVAMLQNEGYKVKKKGG